MFTSMSVNSVKKYLQKAMVFLGISNLYMNSSIKYVCNQCDKLFTQQSNLTTHIQSKHEGVKYACNQCDYKATTQGSLKIHVQAIHEGVKYACSQCDYQAKRQRYLKTHIIRKHCL